MTLSGKQRRHLRALGHGLAPVTQIGKGGVSDAVVAAVDEALAHHELVKVKLLETLELDRDAAAELLAARTQAAIAQVLGRTILLYRADPDEPRILLPRSASAS
ncbi:MAG: ribosome assembly RNA-binding protein YhbY [Kofleriaceae bacterium]